MKIFVSILIFALFIGCTGKRSKKDFNGSKQECDSLYIERYTIFGSGALGGDLISAYLTDSTNFRKYLGTYDDAESAYSCDCNGDSIVLNKVIRNEAKIRMKKVDMLSLRKLKAEGNFE